MNREDSPRPPYNVGSFCGANVKGQENVEFCDFLGINE